MLHHIRISLSRASVTGLGARLPGVFTHLSPLTFHRTNDSNALTCGIARLIADLLN